MPHKTRSGKCAGEVSGGGEGGGDKVMVDNILWDKTLVDVDFLEELVKHRLISESSAPKKVLMEYGRLMKYSLVSFQNALYKV